MSTPDPTDPPSSSVDRESSVPAKSVAAPPVDGKVPMKRLTFDISADLHKRIRLACVQNDVDMSTEIRRLLEERFPKR